MEIELGKIKKQSSEDFVDGIDKQSEFYFIKKLVLNSMTYPELKIEQLDLCPNGKEEFNIWLKVCASVKKDELFDILKVANNYTNFELGNEECAARITIETFPKEGDFNATE